MGPAVAIGLAAVLSATPVEIGGVSEELDLRSPRTGSLEIKFGSFLPRIDEEKGLTGKPYAETFDGGMLLFELEGEKFFYQGIGTAGVAFSAGYAEKYGASVEKGTSTPVGEGTSLKVLPLRVNLVYKFDYAAFRWNVPLIPYVQAGLVYTPWWATKGTTTDARGGRFGYGMTAGMSFMLDILEPRFARDFDSDLGVNHSYVFAEYTHANVDNFGSAGLNLSSRHWMFGFALDY